MPEQLKEYLLIAMDRGLQQWLITWYYSLLPTVFIIGLMSRMLQTQYNIGKSINFTISSDRDLEKVKHAIKLNIQTALLVLIVVIFWIFAIIIISEKEHLNFIASILHLIIPAIGFLIYLPIIGKIERKMDNMQVTAIDPIIKQKYDDWTKKRKIYAIHLK